MHFEPMPSGNVVVVVGDMHTDEGNWVFKKVNDREYSTGWGDFVGSKTKQLKNEELQRLGNR